MHRIRYGMMDRVSKVEGMMMEVEVMIMMLECESECEHAMRACHPMLHPVVGRQAHHIGVVSDPTAAMRVRRVHVVHTVSAILVCLLSYHHDCCHLRPC